MQFTRHPGPGFRHLPFSALAAATALAAFANAAPAERMAPTPSPALIHQVRDDPRLEEVRRMGLELLRSGLNAGSGYAEVWIRDLNTFIVPALEVAPRDTLRQALLVFFHFQGEDGNIVDGYVPADRASVDYKYRISPTQPQFRAHKNTVETDQESSLVQAVCRYVRKTGDTAFLDEKVAGQTVRERLARALEYPLKHRFSEAHGLVWGATTADWGDVQPEHAWGVELDENSHRAIDIYDNALLVVAINEFLDLVVRDDATTSATWRQTRDQLVKNVRRHLWDEARQQFIPHVYLEGSPWPKDFDEQRIFYHGGTAVAIEAGVLSPAEILTVYGQMRANCRLSGAATIGLTLYPAYPEGFYKNPGMGPYSYQNGGDWTWFGARMVRQLAERGYPEAAYRELTPMLDRVLKHRGFHEWWSVDNQPKGSGMFRGSAGVLIQAIDALRDSVSP
ncbi:MAG: hypothetical protein KDM81_02945 [Verrucomicrobiae bacterium]|nr:hypothetical protein [Verrucomicrobiae bacterium]MCP5520266.1 hypothetical protein [Verrucomicrobiales bacterium]